MYCSKCGEELNEGALFYSKCGNRLNEVPLQQTILNKVDIAKRA